MSSPLVVSAMYAKARESLHQGRRLRVRGTQRDVSKNNCFMFHSFRTACYPMLYCEHPHHSIYEYSNSIASYHLFIIYNPTMVSSSKLVAVLSFIVVNSASAFTNTSPIARSTPRIQHQETTTQLDIFGKAFSNDESLGKAANPGLKKVRFSSDCRTIKCSSCAYTYIFLLNHINIVLSCILYTGSQNG